MSNLLNAVARLHELSFASAEQVANLTAMEATQGQMDDFFSQLPGHFEEVASVGD